jgi:hypothetical protein
MTDRTGGSVGAGGGAGPPDIDAARVCWRCRAVTGRLREVDHPDPAVDDTVRVCADGCWLPADISYRCHRCGRTRPFEAVHLVAAGTRTDFIPECVDCTRVAEGR